MYVIRRIRLEHVGHRSARFGSLILDLTNGQGTADGRPLTAASAVDTVLWLRNGGGKSSLLALIFSLLLPFKIDFIGHADGKSLADYIPGGKVSHVILEWEDSERPGTGPALITAGVYQWKDGQCPADTSSGWDRLIRRWYLFRPVPGVLDLDTLPVRRDNSLLSQSNYLRTITETFRANRSAKLVIAEEQWNWAEQLEQYGLDPQVFKIQRDMNKGEGGITDLFRFTTCEDFVNFLIGMVVNPDGPIAAREALEEHADKLATRPDRETEGRFLAEAVLRLRPVQKGTAALTAARHQLEQQVHVVDRAAEHIAEQVRGLRQEAQGIEAEADAAEREVEEAKRRLAGQHTYVAALTAHVERLETAEAQRTTADRSKAVETAQLEREAWEAVEPLLALSARTTEAKETTELLAQQDKSRAPQRLALERSGAALHAALTQSLAGITVDLEAAKADKAGADTEAQESQSEHAAACEAAAAANGRAKDATRRRDEITALVASARTEGVLQKAENPDQALQRLRSARDSTDKQLDDFKDRLEQARLRQGEIAVQRQNVGSELGEVSERHTQLWDRIDDFQSKRRALAAEPRLKEVARIDSNEPLDLDAIGGDLVGLLEDQCRAADEAIASEHAAAAEDRRVSRAVQDTGYLPAAPEVDRAVQSLRNLGAPALTGFQYLRDAVPAERYAEVIATHPHLVGGIVVSGPVPGDDLTALARRANVALTSVIAVAAHTDAEELLAGGPDRQYVVMPVHPGALNSDAADDELRQVNRRLDSLAARQSALIKGRENDRLLSQRLVEHLADFGTRPRAALEAELARLDDKKTALQNRQRELARDAQDAEAAQQHAHSRIQAIHQELVDLAALIERASRLAADSAALPGLESEITDAAHEAAEHQRAGQAHRRRGDKALQNVAKFAAEVQRCNNTRTRWQNDLAEIRAELPDIPAPPDAPTTTPAGTEPKVALGNLRTRWHQALQDWNSGVTDKGLQQRLDTCKTAITELSATLDRFSEPARTRAAEIAADTDAAEPHRRADRREHTEQELDAAKEARTEAKILHQQAEARLEKAEAALARLGEPPTLPDFPTTVEARSVLDTASQKLDGAKDSIHERELAVERLRRAAAETTNRADLLAQAEQSLASAAARHRSDAPSQGDNSSPLSTDALLAEQHDFTAHAASTLTTEQARTLQAKLTTVLDEAASARDRLQRALDRATRAVESLANQPEYNQVVNGRLLAQLTGDLASPTRLAALLADIHEREHVVTKQLAEIDEDQILVVRACVTLVKSVFDDLEEVSRYSRLPRGLGQWTDKRFLDFEIRHEPTDEELARRIAAEIERLTTALTPKTGQPVPLPEAMELAKRLVLAGIGGNGNIVAKVIKPTQSTDTLERESVTAIKKFSGGELLTTSVLLYCTLARMRAAQRDRKIPGGVGTLVLDNPFGKANYLPFVSLQRRVAEAHDIQLVYTTGSNDLPALGRFPLILRLRNGADSRTKQRYVQIEERYGSAVTDALTRTDTDTMTTARLLRRTRPAPADHGGHEAEHE
ncbi:hypothetical protein ACFRAR_12285 [Kitasatospora sp. NPDC056651]|uniref:hypothetical protein n=1 Tax=Kitasatospora sp. NPDC056651 TaxID=3345892 RepID=UPI003694BA45